MPRPWLRAMHAGPARAVVLLLPGGQEHSKRRAHRFRPAYIRMIPFARDLVREGRPHGIGVWLLRYRYRGWNRPDLDPVADARWALAEIRRTHPDAPVLLVGHSMGGRVAFRVADEPGVVAVCALAPWTTAKDHVGQLAGKTVLIAHGELDTVTNPADSAAYAERAAQVTEAVRQLVVPGENHAMMRRQRDNTLLVRRFVLDVLTTG
ncbi:MAG TPA: alpha/beta fold hydrolase [Micromonosporaceae bacterium]|nr:alpha/beta fold hydrolase [Micromonosporaceae bacterium]